MSIYGSLNESLLVSTKEVEQLKKELKEEFKSFYVKGSITRFKNNLKADDYDEEKRKKALNICKSKLQNFIEFNVYFDPAVSTASYTGYFTQYVYGFYKNSFIEMQLLYDNNGVIIYIFREVCMDKCIIPKDVIIEILNKIKGKKYIALVTNNKIHISNIGTKDKILDLLGDTVEKINNKYTDINATVTKNKVIFKKK